jgi:dihydropteroate synthase
MSFAVRPRYAWRLRSRTAELGRRTLIMGILNVTPDSFSDGGAWLDVDAALAHALEMLDAGADIVDVGGESTRPNAVELTPAEEQARVLPVVRAVLRARPEAVVSIDTYHAETARMAVEAGAEIVNDVSGNLWDAEMAATCSALGCGVVLMHTRGRPQDWRGLPALAPGEVVPLVLGELEARAAAAMAAGVAREAIVLDPGFGFGKGHAGDWRLLAGFEAFGELGFPLLAGVSRKGFLRRELAHAGVPGPSESEAREEATAAANTAAVLAGAHILRVHEVARARAVAAIADRLLAPDLHTAADAP